MWSLSSIVVCLLLICTCNAMGVPPTQDAWNAAIQKAKDFLSANNFSISDMVSLATGVGWEKGACVGNIPSIAGRNFSGFCLEDSPTGVRFAQGVSGFPAGINAACTWNRSLIYDRGAAMGAEFKTKGVHIALGPMMNLGRVPEGGRNWEGWGADPYFAGEASYQAVLGIQDQGVVATAKHYIGNEQEHYRTTSTSNIDNRTLHELYVWPFMRSVAAGVGSVMCSYNLVNGVYACQNDYTLNQVLKTELGFQGFVMSDWSATMSGVPSVLAGLDMTMPGDVTMGSGTTYFGQNLVNAVSSGSVSQDRIIDMATRILTPFFLLNQDQNYPSVDFDFRTASVGNKRNAQADHATLIRRIGADSTVLLKNINNALPLSSSVSGTANYTFAIIGSDAAPSVGSYGPSACADHGCLSGTLAQGWGSGTVWFPYLIDPNAAIKTQAGLNNQTVISSLVDDPTQGKAAAVQADVAIVFCNADSGEGYITVDNNFGDRNDLNLWNNGDALIEAVASVHSKVIVVLHPVGPVMMSWINNPNISAVIIAGLPGQESGNSLVDVLFGAVNPSAKLVYTIAKQASDYPANVLYSSSAVHPVINYSEGLLIDYRWFDAKNITPQFEFGYGLSYTNFTYSNLQFSSTTPEGCSTSPPQAGQLGSDVLYTASVTVANVGSYDGAEVVQLYLEFPASAGEPPKVLRGFDKVWVSQGSTAQASFSLTRLDISIWDPVLQSWEVPQGTFGVMIGASSRDIRLQTSFTIGLLPVVSLESTTVSLNEGQSVTLTVVLSEPVPEPVSVALMVALIEPIQASEFSVSPSACLTFAPNTTQATITITTTDDGVYDVNKYFSITLQPPANANLGMNSDVTVEIVNIHKPVVSIASGKMLSVSEGVGIANITLQLSNPSTFSTSITWSILGHKNLNDFSFNNPFVIPPLVTTIEMKINVVEDDIYEGNEVFFLVIASSTNSNVSATNNNVTFTIIDDDPVPSISLVCSDPHISDSHVVTVNIVLSNPEEGSIGLVFQVDNTNTTETILYSISGFPSVTIPTDTASVPMNVSVQFDTAYDGLTVFSLALNKVSSGTATINTNPLQLIVEENVAQPTVTFLESSYDAMQAGVTVAINIEITTPTRQLVVVPYELTSVYASGTSVTTGNVSFASLSSVETINVYVDPNWTGPATISLELPTVGPAVLGSISTFIIYNNFSIPETATTSTTAAATTSVTLGDFSTSSSSSGIAATNGEGSTTSPEQPSTSSFSTSQKPLSTTTSFSGSTTSHSNSSTSSNSTSPTPTPSSPPSPSPSPSPAPASGKSHSGSGVVSPSLCLVLIFLFMGIHF